MTERCRLRLYAGAIAGAGLLAYADSIHGAFVYDDREAIVGNGSIDHLGTALFPPAGTTASGRPLLNLTLALSHALSGADPWGYHAVNVLIQILAGLVLFGLVRRTLELARAPSPGLAFAVALLWTVHPLGTEAVTYVVQRAESQMGLFYLLVFYCFARWQGEAPGSRLWPALAIASCLLSQASKEVAITAPLLVFLYDRTFVAGSFGRSWRLRWKFFAALAALDLALAAGLLASTGWNRGGSIGVGVHVSWIGYLLTQFRAIATYVRLAFWPHPLVFDYGPVIVHRAAEVLPYAVVVFALVGATVYGLVRRPAIGFLGMWFFGILAVTSLVPGTTQYIVEHRMYLPLAALIALVVVGAGRSRPKVVARVAAAAAAACVALTAARNSRYATARTLWQATVDEVPGNPYARTNLAAALLDDHEPDAALRQCALAIQAYPGAVEARVTLGNALVMEGRTGEAISVYRDALQLNPNYALGHLNFGNVLEETGRMPEAVDQYLAALRLSPNETEAENNLGLALAAMGRFGEAERRYAAALRLDPDFAPAEFNWGNACRMAGDYAEAVRHYVAALELRPHYPDASLNLGNLMLQAGRLDEARPLLEDAVAGKPNDAAARNSLGLALLRSGEPAAAAEQFSAALRLNPNYAPAKANLNLALRAR